MAIAAQCRLRFVRFELSGYSIYCLTQGTPDAVQQTGLDLTRLENATCSIGAGSRC
jgi:hypothetical protein